MDLVEIGEAGRKRPCRRNGRISCTKGRQGGHAANHRARHSHRRCWYRHARLHGANWIVTRLFRQPERSRREYDDACYWRGRLHRPDELFRLRGVRLHGRLDWFVQQSALWYRHSGGDRRCAIAGDRGKTVRVAGRA